eukprot:923565-Pleurochrysis_carterae.AAC.1
MIVLNNLKGLRKRACKPVSATFAPNTKSVSHGKSHKFGLTLPKSAVSRAYDARGLRSPKQCARRLGRHSTQQSTVVTSLPDSPKYPAMLVPQGYPPPLWRVAASTTPRSSEPARLCFWELALP